MIGAVDAFPYAHRPDQDGTWTVFHTRSGVTAAPGFLPVMDAEGVAAILNRNTVGPASRLHRYAKALNRPSSFFASQGRLAWIAADPRIR